MSAKNRVVPDDDVARESGSTEFENLLPGSAHAASNEAEVTVSVYKSSSEEPPTSKDQEIPLLAAQETTSTPNIWTSSVFTANPDDHRLVGERNPNLEDEEDTEITHPNIPQEEEDTPSQKEDKDDDLYDEIASPPLLPRSSISMSSGSNVLIRKASKSLSNRISLAMGDEGYRSRQSEAEGPDIQMKKNDSALRVTFDEETQSFVWKSNECMVKPTWKDRLLLKCIQLMIYRDNFTGGFKMMSKNESIHPQSPLRTRWDIFCLAPLLYVCLFVPFQIGFDLAAILELDLWVDITLGLDIIFNFFTGYEKDGHVELDKKKSMIHYLRFWFWLDLIATLPVEHFTRLTAGSFGSYTRVLKLVRLIRLLRVLRLGRILNRLKWWASIRFAVRKIIRFIIMITIVAHWNACLWGFMARVDNWESSWAGMYGMEPSTPRSSQYLTCLHWAITTMTTIGYGDIVPVNTAERVLTIIVMCSGSCAYAYGITQIVTIVSNLSKATVRYQGRMDMLHEYMTVRRLPRELCHRILEFYEFKKEHSCSFLQENDILNDLPHSLRSEVAMFLHESLAARLADMPLFKGLGDVFIRSIIVRMRFDAYPPGETVVMEGEIGNNMFFISKGKLNVRVNGREVARLEEGEFFGEVAMYHNKGRRTATVGTITYCEVCSLSRRDMEAALQPYPMVMHKIKQRSTDLWEKYQAMTKKPATRTTSGSEPGSTEDTKDGTEGRRSSRKSATGSGFPQIGVPRESELRPVPVISEDMQQVFTDIENKVEMLYDIINDTGHTIPNTK